jgi:aspartyl/asparaginyl-tRNA synthetase
MKTIPISELEQHTSQTITLQGWVHTIRDQKQMQFIILRDNTGQAQIINIKSENPSLAEQITSLTRESTITITGEVIENPQVRLGAIEIHLHHLTIETAAATPLPLDHLSENEPGIEHRLNWRHLDLRSPKNHLMSKIQTTAEWAMREYWHQESFIEIHSPKLMGTASESGARLHHGLPHLRTPILSYAIRRVTKPYKKL